MKNSKEVLSNLIKQAMHADGRGDVVGRQQALRTIEDLPLPAEYICEALRKHNLISVYKGLRD